MSERVNVYSGDELVGTVPMPDAPPNHVTWEMAAFHEPLTLGIRRRTFDDIVASIVRFEIKWHTDPSGWTQHAGLHCDQMYGPGDWECIPGFRYIERAGAPPHER